jgi:hypothetical protein
MTRQPRTLYYITRTIETLPNPRIKRTVEVCDETYTYDYDEAADEAFDLAYSEARSSDQNSEVSKTNTTPATYCVFHPATHMRTLYTVQTTDDGIDL